MSSGESWAVPNAHYDCANGQSEQRAARSAEHYGYRSRENAGRSKRFPFWLRLRRQQSSAEKNHKQQISGKVIRVSQSRRRSNDSRDPFANMVAGLWYQRIDAKVLEDSVYRNGDA